MRKPAKKPEPGRVVLKMESVSKIYHMGTVEVPALRDLNLTVRDREMICILGPSGSGKSTLLHIMGILDTPTSGKVYIDGVETSGMSEPEQANIRGKKIGFVFQTFNLITSLTAQENVALPLMLCDGCPDRMEKAKKVLESLGMGHRLKHYPGQLSGGERQRVAIGRALINDPEILLADEPTGNLDSKTGGEVLNILSKLHAEGRTIIIITHDENITKLAQRVVRLRDGTIVEA